MKYGRWLVPPLIAGGYLLLRPRLLRWGATDEEARRKYPGDELIPDATAQSTMAVTLPAPPEEVWPWLAQMGCDRAGWYSWDRLDNGGRPSAESIVPRWQHLAVGDRLASVPGGGTWFTVAMLDRPRTLVLRTNLELPSGKAFDPHGPRPRAFTEGIWAFHLAALPGGLTRLVVRTRGVGRPRPAELVTGLLLGEPAHLVMQVRQFHNLHRRLVAAAERERRAVPATVS